MAQEQVIVEVQKKPDDCEEVDSGSGNVEPEVKECDCKKYTLIFNFH